MREIRNFIVHCSDTPDQNDYSAAEIDKWHKDRGFDKIGYHWVIRKDGCLEQGRLEKEVGAHCKEHNIDSIGVCVIGRDDFEDIQMDVLRLLYQMYKKRYQDIQTWGHCEFDHSKTCPNFDVQKILENDK